MAISWSDVVNLDSSLSSVATGTQDLILRVVDRQIDDDAWIDLADDGRLFLAAHFGTIINNGGAGAGPITSESLGPMSRSYGLSASAEGSLGLTKWGVTYRDMIGLLPCSLGFVP